VQPQPPSDGGPLPPAKVSPPRRLRSNSFANEVRPVSVKAWQPCACAHLRLAGPRIRPWPSIAGVRNREDRRTLHGVTQIGRARAAAQPARLQVAPLPPIRSASMLPPLPPIRASPHASEQPGRQEPPRCRPPRISHARGWPDGREWESHLEPGRSGNPTWNPAEVGIPLGTQPKWESHWAPSRSGNPAGHTADMLR
jgi:hypothetical protein